MTRTAKLKLAACGFIAAIGFALPSADVAASPGDAPQANPSRAASDANRAVRMLERGRADRAVEYAERAVLMAPADGAHRALLGQAYLASGRFASAEASFDAARQLGDVTTRAVVGHVLSLIALNRSAEALALVNANAETLPASDLGLALTLAGQPERGVMVLTDVVRAGDSTPRDRQNLALSYAAAGRWLEARLIAAQDLGAAGVGARIEQWASMLQSADPRTRIASLLGTSVNEDPGMPVRLALVDGAAPVLAMADDPAPIAQYAPPPPADSNSIVDTMLADAAARSAEPVEVAPVLAMASEAPVEVEVAASDVAPDAPAPAAVAEVREAALVFVSNPVIQPLRSMVATVAPLRDAPAAAASNGGRGRVARVAGTNLRPAAAAASAPAAVPAATVETADAAVTPPTGPVRTSGWVVQLGAFDSPAIAQRSWARLASRFPVLGAHDGVSTLATVGGRTFHRLNATGFDSREAANAVCASVRSAGGTCFVRSLPASERAQWASRPLPTRVASR